MQMKFNCNERERRVTGKKSGWRAGRYKPLATPTYHDTVTALCLHIRLAIKKTTHTETPSRQPGSGRDFGEKVQAQVKVKCFLPNTHTLAHIMCVNLHTLSAKYSLVLRICVLIKYANKLVRVCVWHFRNCKQNSPKKGFNFLRLYTFFNSKNHENSRNGQME